jgi:hypothetical protein
MYTMLNLGHVLNHLDIIPIRLFFHGKAKGNVITILRIGVLLLKLFREKEQVCKEKET